MAGHIPEEHILKIHNKIIAYRMQRYFEKTIFLTIYIAFSLKCKDSEYLQVKRGNHKHGLKDKNHMITFKRYRNNLWENSTCLHDKSPRECRATGNTIKTTCEKTTANF